MSRAKAIFQSIRFASSIISARTPATQSLLVHLTRSPSVSSSFLPSRFGRSFFSSKSISVLELVLANDSPETELEKLSPVLSHEDAVYVVKRLDGEPRKALAFFKWVRGREGFHLSSTLYSLVVRILATKGLMKEFWVTLREMKEQGFYLDEETHGTIQRLLKEAKLESDSVALTHFHQRMIEENGRIKDVNRVVSLILPKGWRYEVERELTEMKIPISDNLVIRVLKELRNLPSKAISFFRWAGSFPDFSHNTVTYNAAARVLARDESIEDFWSIVEEMKNKGYDMDIDTYIKIVRQFQKWRLMQDAVKLYEFMMDSPYKPSVQDCSFLLRSLSTLNDLDVELVYRVVGKLESSSTHHQKAVYDGIHRCLTAAGRFDLAEDTVKSMRNAGYEPDNIVYSQLVFGLCKVGRLDEACKVVEEMEEQGGCPPDIKTWTILIQGLCDANEVGRALMQFTQVMERDVDVDADLVDVLVNGFLNQDKVDGAYELFREMVDRAKLKPWQATFKHLIDKLIGERKLEEGMQLLRLMKKHNYPPYTEPFTQYISKHGTVNDAAELLKALSVREYPSAATYFNVLHNFFKESRHSEAKDLLYQCPPHIRHHPRISELFGSAKNHDAVAVAAVF